jgi:hypothetical protein
MRTGFVVVCAVSMAAVAAACGGAPAKPAKPPAPVARPIADVATLSGTWRATDIDGWTYELAIAPGTYKQTVQRTTLGACTQSGTLDTYEKAYGQKYVSPEEQRRLYETGGAEYGGAPPAGPAPGTVLALVLSLQTNQCNPDYGGAQLIMLASDFDGDGFTLRTTGGWGAEESHRYQRVVATPAPATAK